MRIEHITRFPEETQALARAIGAHIQCPAVIALHGDLGSGKTCFAQGLARGLSVPEDYYITSPTYTLINEYPGRCPLYHVDLYRLEADADPVDIGLEEILCGEGVAAIEWAERLAEGVMDAPIVIHLELWMSGAESGRRILIETEHPEHAKMLAKVMRLVEDDRE